jgi:hypothetical protein
MPKVVYSDKGLEEWQGAITKFPLFPYFGLGQCKIIIRTKYLKDEGILKHELKHTEQYKKKWNHALKYKFNKNYRFECELEAYKEQIKEYKYTKIEQCSWIIDALVNKYNLNVPVAFIVQKIKDILEEGTNV